MKLNIFLLASFVVAIASSAYASPEEELNTVDPSKIIIIPGAGGPPTVIPIYIPPSRPGYPPYTILRAPKYPPFPRSLEKRSDAEGGSTTQATDDADTAEVMAEEGGHEKFFIYPPFGYRPMWFYQTFRPFYFL
ncbi:hypothetical protein B0O80DRAFT_448988 [Mortierella sp. GBAus27b]|nr:hypothetical protein BGX31_009228 [Mortierella sp. GBA43]KAI8355318.1 hypothetical protein B0O80DRAFT_448988 [Mortierella sp. GBAus27b]